MDEWSQEFEQILMVKSDMSKCMGRLCAHTSSYYRKQRTWLLVPASTIAWSLNLFGMFATYYGNDKIPESLVILIASIGNFIVATFTTIAEKSQVGDKVELFNQTSREYTIIASEITQALMYHPCNRKPPRQLIDSMDRKYNDLMKSTPNIPEIIIQEFKLRNNNNEDFSRMSKPEHIVDIKPTSSIIYKAKKYADGEREQISELEMYEDISLRNNIVKENDTVNDTENDTENVIIDIHEKDK